MGRADRALRRRPSPLPLHPGAYLPDDPGRVLEPGRCLRVSEGAPSTPPLDRDHELLRPLRRRARLAPAKRGRRGDHTRDLARHRDTRGLCARALRVPRGGFDAAERRRDASVPDRHPLDPACGDLHPLGDRRHRVRCLDRAPRSRRLGDLCLHRLVERGIRLLAPDTATSDAPGRGALAARRGAAELPLRRWLLPDGAVGDRHPDHSPLSVHDVGPGAEVMAEVRFESIRKTFGKVTAVDDVELEVADGDFVVLLGPSGCGKTTLLRCLAGLEKVDAGRIFIGDRDVTHLPPGRRRIAMVFQSYAVFPHMTLYDNIGFGLKMQKESKATIKTRVESVAALVHIENLLDRYPAQISGGQRQRVALARAIAAKADVLLMDEPLSNLDALLRMEMRAELKTLLKQLGTTTIYVTHDQVEALSMGDRIAVMKAGLITQVDTPLEVYDHPAS